jgi:hypothetical protein
MWGGRYWPVWEFCADYGWGLGLLALILSGIGFFGRGKHVFSGYAMIIALASLIWWATPHLYR